MVPVKVRKNQKLAFSSGSLQMAQKGNLQSKYTHKSVFHNVQLPLVVSLLGILCVKVFFGLQNIHNILNILCAKVSFSLVNIHNIFYILCVKVSLLPRKYLKYPEYPLRESILSKL